jgi:hypothetical protein
MPRMVVIQVSDADDARLRGHFESRSPGEVSVNALDFVIGSDDQIDSRIRRMNGLLVEIGMEYLPYSMGHTADTTVGPETIDLIHEKIVTLLDDLVPDWKQWSGELFRSVAMVSEDDDRWLGWTIGTLDKGTTTYTAPPSGYHDLRIVTNEN